MEPVPGERSPENSNTHYLIVYDKPTGRLLACREYPDSQGAIHARFQLERVFGLHPDLEIVALGAPNLDTLRHTHGRYFTNERNQWVG